MIVGMMRVKNEERWIARSIESQLPLIEHLFILDDHSTDRTVEICRQYDKVIVIPSPFSELNESQDKNYLLSKVAKVQPEWILAIDGDEMLTPEATRELPRALKTTTTASLALRIWYLWDRDDQVRVDGVYGRFHRPSVFRPDGQRFEATSYGGNFHCGNVPIGLRHPRQVSELAILHFGYLHREDRERKYRFYNERDPHNEFEDAYRHMVIGDLFPAASRFRHAGPLTLQPL